MEEAIAASSVHSVRGTQSRLLGSTSIPAYQKVSDRLVVGSDVVVLNPC